MPRAQKRAALPLGHTKVTSYKKAVCYNPATLKKRCVRTLFLLLGLLLASFGLAWPALAAPPTREAYKQYIAEAYAAAQRSDRIGLDDSTAALLTTQSVLMPDGKELPVDNRWLRAALDQEPPDFVLITARLGAILDALNRERSDADTQALTKLEQIYEAPPFTSRALPSAWTRFWQSVGDAIARFFDRLFGSLPTPTVTPVPARAFKTLSPLGWGLMIVGALLVIAIVVYAARGIRRSILSERRVIAEAEQEETISAAEANDRAQADARAGDYRNAARHLYLASLLWLEEHGMLRYDRSRTNHEYLAQVRGKQVHDVLVPVVNTFERVWYGHHSLDAQSFQDYEQQVAALREQGSNPP